MSTEEPAETVTGLEVGNAWVDVLARSRPGIVVVATDAGEVVVVDPWAREVGGTSVTYYPGRGINAAFKRSPALCFRWIGPRLGRTWLISWLPEEGAPREARTVGAVVSIRTVAWAQ